MKIILDLANETDQDLADIVNIIWEEQGRRMRNKKFPDLSEHELALVKEGRKVQAIKGVQ